MVETNTHTAGVEDERLLELLLDLEHAGWASLCDGSGARFYGEMMSADGRMVLANGAVMGRAQVIDALEQSPPWAGYRIEDPQLVRIGDAGAAVVYTGYGERDGAEPFVGRMTSVYVGMPGTWQLVLYQQTPVQTPTG